MGFAGEVIQDMFKEFGSIGSGHVSTVFSEIFDKNFLTEIKELKTTGKEKAEIINKLLNTQDDNNSFMVSKISGLLDGAIIFNFDKKKNYKLSKNFNVDFPYDEVLYEIFNISTSYYLSAVANLLNEKISVSEFEFNKNEAHILNSILENIENYMCVESSIILKENNETVGSYIFIVSKNSLDKAISKFDFCKVLVCRKILLCDDTSFMRVLLKGIIQRKYPKMIIEEINNGSEALTKYQQFSPDLVIMDMVMPDCDGITAAKNILKFDSQAKIIFTSGSVLQLEVIRAFNVGGKDFIAKPYENERVLNAINKFLIKE